MTYKLVGLTLSLGLLLYAAAFTVLPSARLSLRAVDLLGPETTLTLAAAGRGPLLQGLLRAELVAALPWLALGVCLAMTLRMALRLWQREQPAPARISVVDAAGVEVELQGAAFDHVPVMSRMALAPLPDARFASGATELERQAIAAIAALPGLPADIASVHDMSLLSHTLRVYDKAVSLYGAGSLQAIGAATHDLGKLLAYEQRDGRWVEAYPFHDNLTSVVLSRLPAFWRLPHEQRARIAAMINVLCTHQIPADLEPELSKAINACRALDRGATYIEKKHSRSQHGTPEVDFTALCSAVSAIVADLPAWNINGRLRDAAPVEGWWLPDEPVLLLPATRVRAWLASRVSADMAAQMNLAQPSTGNHAADRPIADALRNEGLLAEVVQGRKLRSGWWRAAIARQQRIVVAGLRGDRIPELLTQRWGKPTKEVVLEAL